ncbi:MAG TPA: hypothetical protein PK668_09565 [Myxococcota bacterium]|nr:hypothetical protein [Myxococcota bacterium]HRY92770.1 hypothetical protein [Myxococcota bacterium]HSA20435.1 hypothetical protein [Myxococcota bacterium]
MKPKFILVILLLAGAGGGVLWWMKQLPVLPNLVLQDARGTQFSLDTLRGANIDLVIGLLGPTDAASQLACRQLQAAFLKYGKNVSFAGLVFSGTPDQIAKLAQDQQLGFPLYPLQAGTAPDPKAVMQFFEMAGESYGMTGAAIQSGTILVIDHKRRLRALLQFQDAGQLDEKLRELGY